MKNILDVKRSLLPGQIEKKDEGDIEIVSFSVIDAPKKESRIIPKGTLKEQIELAVEDVRLTMLENLKASKALVDAETKKRKAHYLLQKAKERLNSLEKELME